jgi:BMFP domain-containing protein YqiC
LLVADYTENTRVARNPYGAGTNRRVGNLLQKNQHCADSARAQAPLDFESSSRGFFHRLDCAGSRTGSAIAAQGLPRTLRGNAVISATPIDALARRLAKLVPAAGSREAGEDLLANLRGALRAGLRDLDLVTRDEFDVQRCVLLRTREMVEALEHRITQLEAMVGGRAPPQ